MTLKAKIAMGLAIALVASAAVTGVAFLTAQQKEAAEEPGLFVGGEKVEDPGIMMTVGGQDLDFDEYRYYYMLNKSYAEMSGGPDMWDTDYDGAMAMQLRNSTEETILQVYAWLKIASDEGISLSDEDKQEVVDTMNKQKEELGEEGFAKNLSSMFFTSEDMYLRISEQQRLVQKAQDELKARYTADVEENLDDMYATAKHILIGFDGIQAGTPPADSVATPEEALLDTVGDAVNAAGSESAAASGSVAQSEVQKSSQVDVSLPAEAQAQSAPASSAAASQPQSAAAEMTAEEKEAAALQIAQQLREQLRQAEASGADVNALFDQLVKDYGTDPGMEQSPGGYTFGDGEMVQEFYDGSMDLQPGEISEPIRTDYGYHIIMRLPLDREAMGGGDPEAALEQAASQMMSEDVKAVQESLQVDYGAYYSEVTPGGMH